MLHAADEQFLHWLPSPQWLLLSGRPQSADSRIATLCCASMMSVRSMLSCRGEQEAEQLQALGCAHHHGYSPHRVSCGRRPENTRQSLRTACAARLRCGSLSLSIDHLQMQLSVSGASLCPRSLALILPTCCLHACNVGNWVEIICWCLSCMMDGKTMKSRLWFCLLMVYDVAHLR